MKLCIDCKYFGRNGHMNFGGRTFSDACMHESAQYGFVREVHYMPCEMMRSPLSTKCGENAKLFSPKEAVL